MRRGYRWRRVVRYRPARPLHALLATLVVTVSLTGGCDNRHGSTKPKPTKTMSADDKFRKDCLIKGGDPIIVRNNGKVNRTCLISLK